MLALALALFAGCGGSNGDDAGAPGSTVDGTPGPGQFQGDYETSPAFFTRMSAPMDSGSVHGSVRIWYSANVADLPPAGPFVVPEGTVAIKNEYDSMGVVFVKVVMVKKSAGYDPDHSDWYYEARNPDDSLASNPTPGTPSLCIDCHTASADTDYLQGFALMN